MLTNLIENGKKKCEKYWPEVAQSLRWGEKGDQDGVLTVFVEEEKTFANYVERKIILDKKSSFLSDDYVDGAGATGWSGGGSGSGGDSGDSGPSKLEIKQFHFNVWPDKGVPTSRVAMASFLTTVRDAVGDAKLLIHCSAGVGRTGTFIALNELVEKAKADGIEAINVFEEVKLLRKDRMKMVQAEEQLGYIYDVLEYSCSKALDPETVDEALERMRNDRLGRKSRRERIVEFLDSKEKEDRKKKGKEGEKKEELRRKEEKGKKGENRQKGRTNSVFYDSQSDSTEFGKG